MTKHGILRIELTTEPDDYPKQDRNAAVRIVETVGGYLLGKGSPAGGR